MADLAKAIRKLKPTAEFSFINEDYSTIKWDVLEGAAPTKKKLMLLLSKLKLMNQLKQQIKQQPNQHCLSV